MGYHYGIIILIAVLAIGMPLAYAGNHNNPPDPCTGNPTPDPVTVLSAEVVSSDAVRIEFDHSQCATEYDIERSDNGGTFVRIVNIDRNFDVLLFRPDATTQVTFYLDETTLPDDEYDYRVLAKTQTREATSYSPIVSVRMPSLGTSLATVSSGFLVQSTTITPILIDYIEGSTPLQNLLWEYLKDFNLIALFINWAFAHHGADLWTSDPDPQDQAQLFYIPPTPDPAPSQICTPVLDVLFKHDQSNGQTINFTVTLLDYPTIIHQEAFTSIMANRIHVKNFQLTEAEEQSILDYENIYVQINAQGEGGLSPPNDRSLVIHDIIFTVPEDQSAC